MTRTSHRAHPTPQFPVYALEWTDDSTLLLGGGGGASRSGIENKLKLATVAKDGRKVTYINELKLSNEEDAPMTIAIDRAGKKVVTGVNASSSSIQGGRNEHCRLYSYADDSLAFERGVGTIEASWSDDYPYQKFTSISPSSEYLAVGTTDDKVSLLRLSSLDVAVGSFEVEGELVDLDWGGVDGELLAVTMTSAVLLYEITNGEKVSLSLKQTLYPPSLDIIPAAFRSARFSPLVWTPPTIHAVLNATKAPKRGAPRKAWVCTFGLVAGPSSGPISPAEKQSYKGKEKELGRWDVIAGREVAGKPVTVFDVSADGKLLAYGSSDLSLGILDSKTLAPLLKILHAHSFPPTALKFNPSANLLVSASADNTIRVVVVPPSFAGLSMTMIAVLIAIILVILAAVLQMQR